MSTDKAMWQRRTAMVCARWISLVVALCAVMVAVPQPASAKSLVPFRATMFERVISLEMCGPMLRCPISEGRGQATHLGRTTETVAVVVDLAHPDAAGCFPEIRKTILTAANGDQIMMTATGKSCSTGPTTVTAVDSYVVTGGTGRFSGASGSGTNTALVDLASRTAVVTFIGALSSPGSLK
jgi:hypothetical protein